MGPELPPSASHAASAARLDVGAQPAPVWGHPAAVLGAPPGKRMSAVVALSRTDLLVYGGWIYSCGEVGGAAPC